MDSAFGRIQRRFSAEARGARGEALEVEHPALALSNRLPEETYPKLSQYIPNNTITMIYINYNVDNVMQAPKEWLPDIHVYHTHMEILFMI